jgi:hypothetical protein
MSGLAWRPMSGLARHGFFFLFPLLHTIHTITGSLLGQLASFFGVFDCAEVQPVAVVCRSSDLLVCCGV